MKWVTFEVFDDDEVYDDVYVSARADSINAAVRRKFNRLRAYYRDNDPIPGVYWPVGTLRLGPIWEIGTTTYNVGSYEAVSNFQNPSGNTALGKESAEDPGADKYKGTIYWEYSYILSSGAWSRLKEGWHECDFTTIKTKHAATPDLLQNNQTMIGEPKISAGAQRFFEDETYTVWETRTSRTIIEVGLPPRVLPGKRVKATYKRRVCNQTESDQYEKKD